MVHAQDLSGKRHLIDTTIVVRGSWHLRAHRVTLDADTNTPVTASEGPSPLGYEAGSSPSLESDTRRGWEKAAVMERRGDCYVGIMRLQGYDAQQRAEPWRGRHDLNSVHSHYVLPLLKVTRLEPRHDLVCLVHVGRYAIDFAGVASSIAEARWLEDDSFILRLQDGHG